MSNIDLNIELVSSKQLHCRVYIAIKQFTEGLESVGGMWTLIKTNSEAFKDVFCYEAGRLTRTKFKNLYVVEYSEKGSNNYQNEIDTVYAWEEYLLECESEHFLLQYLYHTNTNNQFYI